MEMDGKTLVLCVLGFINNSPQCAFVYIDTSCQHGLDSFGGDGEEIVVRSGALNESVEGFDIISSLLTLWAGERPVAQPMMELKLFTQLLK